MRSTVYHAASLSERRSAHAALAAAVEGAERAWHLAACAVAPDEAVAAALEQAALDARGRGAHATAMRDLGRAAQLTPDAEPRARRLLAAAGDAVRCGAPDRALGMLDEAAALTEDPLLLADAERLRGHVETAPRLAGRRARAARARGRSRALARPAARGGDVPRGVGGAHGHRRLPRADRVRRAGAGALGRHRARGRAARDRGDRRRPGRARRDRAGRRRAGGLRAVPDGGRPAGQRRDRRAGRAGGGLGRGLGRRGADPLARARRGARRERGLGAHPSARRQRAPGPAARTLGRGAGGRFRGGRARRGHRVARAAAARARGA